MASSSSSSSSHDSMKVLEQSRVSPSPASVAPQPASLPLTFFDILWLYTSPVERLFLYPFPHSTVVFTESYLPNLKSSLSLALHHFYPLAGKLRRSPESADRYELHYAEGDSVSLTVAETDLDFLDLVGYHARDSNKLSSLVPRLPQLDDDNRPLLAIQVTLFPDHGIGIGFTVHHAACDGFNSTHFIKSWASSCKSSGHVSLVPPAPSFGRSVIVDPCNLYSEFLRDMNSFIADNNPVLVLAAVESAPSNLVHATFTLAPDRIEGLKTLVRSKAKSFNCSTFVVSCAYLWTCIVKARGYQADKTAHFSFAVDWRKRLQPPTPDTYFGNCLGGCFAEAMVGDLVQEDGIIAAAEAIGRAIEVLKGGVSKCFSGFVSRVFALLVAECPPLSVAGSPKFKVYDVDFGWGRPLKVEVPSIKETGALSLSDSRDVQCGLEIGLVLPKHDMEALVTMFKEGLALF
ncbi:putative coumaroyl-CoA:anthocyanidin 3-O-glucoside-6''-O-coumaroyltransferase 2 [Iris pallida]|uniref:Coumaroyl-CoA:anthocyanidin 3-O-glucoside-6''-O-coumaroyltransferase 2 n=1 Tax=Iris pallida TaxID=29817 RepID=A0AAX6DKY8_IRIPA|nr:putative coumaroyl-CoA:anthocyanidin 3-O-glucoside-6''-O-coumaroyltransferase 2 [Iris pallida]